MRIYKTGCSAGACSDFRNRVSSRNVSGDERTAKLAVNLDVELRQYLTESRSSYCGLGVKILGLKDVDISFWGGVTFGFSF